METATEFFGTPHQIDAIAAEAKLTPNEVRESILRLIELGWFTKSPATGAICPNWQRGMPS